MGPFCPLTGPPAPPGAALRIAAGRGRKVGGSHQVARHADPARFGVRSRAQEQRYSGGAVPGLSLSVTLTHARRTIERRVVESPLAALLLSALSAPVSPDAG